MKCLIETEASCTRGDRHNNSEKSLPKIKTTPHMTRKFWFSLTSTTSGPSILIALGIFLGMRMNLIISHPDVLNSFDKCAD